jgi:hypothetical protein
MYVRTDKYTYLYMYRADHRMLRSGMTQRSRVFSAWKARRQAQELLRAVLARRLVRRQQATKMRIVVACKYLCKRRRIARKWSDAEFLRRALQLRASVMEAWACYYQRSSLEHALQDKQLLHKSRILVQAGVRTQRKRVLSSWSQLAVSTRALRTKGKQLFSCLWARVACRALLTWHQHASTASRQRGRMRTVVLRLLHRWLAMAFDTWSARTRVLARLRRIMSRLMARGERGLSSEALRRWTCFVSCERCLLLHWERAGAWWDVGWEGVCVLWMVFWSMLEWLFSSGW